MFGVLRRSPGSEPAAGFSIASLRQSSYVVNCKAMRRQDNIDEANGTFVHLECQKGDSIAIWREICGALGLGSIDECNFRTSFYLVAPGDDRTRRWQGLLRTTGVVAYVPQPALFNHGQEKIDYSTTWSMATFVWPSMSEYETDARTGVI